MNPFYSLQTRMQASVRNASAFAGFHSLPADTDKYADVIMPFVKKRGSIIDVGCGLADIWTKRPSRFDEVSTITAIDVLRYTSWADAKRPQNLVLMQSWPAMLTASENGNCVILLKNVLPFLNGQADVRRLFWSLTSWNSVVIISHPQYPQLAYATASPAVLLLGQYQFRRLATLSWEDSQGIVWTSIVIADFAAQWLSKTEAGYRRGENEPCPVCGTGGRNIVFDHFKSSDQGVGLCSNCSYQDFFPAKDWTTVSDGWNTRRVNEFRMVDDQR